MGLLQNENFAAVPFAFNIESEKQEKYPAVENNPQSGRKNLEQTMESAPNVENIEKFRSYAVFFITDR